MPFTFNLYTLSWILMLTAIAVTAVAQIWVSSAYRKYSRVWSRSGYTGSQAARHILDRAGLNRVPVEQVSGRLTDFYDPSRNVLCLSRSTYNDSTVAALGVAAHECGHALQDAENYGALRLRSAMVPVARFGSGGSWILIILGMALGLANLAFAGVLLFALVVVFQLVSLPVEFNASRRALAALEGGGFLRAEELPMAAQVLRAAALTYVAAALSSILQLARLLLIVGGRRR